MCGIAGFTRSLCPEGDLDLLKRMGTAIAHRGPDAHGEYLDDGIGLAHRRLSIIDLSKDGNQPMTSACGRYIIVFNGEIYNFQELRERYRESGVSFKSRTDTEVILHAYAKSGRKCLEELHGMFAFALWDREEQTLFLARDRVGKKPLYWWWAGADKLAFASELKSILALPEFSPQVDSSAVVDYLKYLYVPDPKTIYRNVYKLQPGHCLTLKQGEEPQVEQYWDVDFGQQYDGTFEEATEELLRLIDKKTSLRMIADVPLGAFLSGGVDSSGLVALMAKNSDKPVKTCTIGFDDRRHDESEFAREVAQIYATDHKEYTVRENLTDTIRLLPRYFDEPFADSSALPTYHVSRLARQDVTVALAGDGGDEAFGGYQKYVTELIEARTRSSVPRFALQLINKVTNGAQSGVLKKAATLSSSALSDPALGYYRTNSFVTDDQLASLLSDDLSRDTSGYDPSQNTVNYWQRQSGQDHVTRMLYTDIKTYLPGDILVKADRTSMAHSLEVRAPLLDHQIIEFAAGLPSRWKLVNKEKKIILRQAFSRFLSQDFLARKKQGFTIPLDTWFRSELTDLFRSSVLENSDLDAFFDRKAIDSLWSAHQQKRANHGQLLWSLLSFGLWQQEYLHN